MASKIPWSFPLQVVLCAHKSYSNVVLCAHKMQQPNKIWQNLSFIRSLSDEPMYMIIMYYSKFYKGKSSTSYNAFWSEMYIIFCNVFTANYMSTTYRLRWNENKNEWKLHNCAHFLCEGSSFYICSVVQVFCAKNKLYCISANYICISNSPRLLLLLATVR